MLLDLRAPPEELDRFRRSHRVTHSASPRLLVVVAEPGLADDPAVADLDSAELTPDEALFAAAWALRSEPEHRRGEGRSWGSPPE
ncbi:hypothetical protein ACFQV2_02640 [Actinokineospora soli]|uniref:Uncharacterized protein n=1 Tax=Actinokineospora soli TaxID=1048753 RepID=A0ABW2TGX3_9PSEU